MNEWIRTEGEMEEGMVNPEGVKQEASSRGNRHDMACSL